MASRVGFLGLGTMGTRQAANLRWAGFELMVWNRTRERADAWAAEHGAEVAGTPRAVGAAAEIVVSMVIDGAQVEEVLLGPEGAAHDARPGTLFVDMSTIAPADARRIGAALAERGLGFLDAPVTGSAPRAEDGSLTIMAGGEPDAYERARPLFEAMGRLVVHAGPVGQGQLTKVLSNAVTAVHCATLAQVLVAAKATGADLDVLREVMGAGSAASAMLELKGPAMVAHDFSTLFKLAHMVKDVKLCLAETAAAGVPFPFAAAAGELYAAGVGHGLGESDFSAVLAVIEGLADVRI